MVVEVLNIRCLQYFAAIPKEALEGQDALQVLKEKAEGMDFFDTLTRVEGQPKYRIRSKWDNRVVDFEDGRQVMNSAHEGNPPSQLWAIFETSTGIKIMNVFGKDLLQATGQGIYEWTHDESTMVLLDSKGTGKALRRGKKKKDGALIGGWNYAPYKPQNKYVFELIEQ